MREIEHYLDAIQVGVEGALEDYRRSDPGAFFKPEEPKPRRKPEDPERRDRSDHGAETLDHEVGLAEIVALTAGEIDLAEHPNGEIPIDDGMLDLLAELEDLTGGPVGTLAAGAELTRLVADELGDDGPETGID